MTAALQPFPATIMGVDMLAPKPKPYRVLVFGSRNWPSFDIIRSDMWHLREVIGDYTVVHGDARGADAYADLVAKNQGWEIDPFYAEWVKHGKAAGPIRNQQMLDSGIDYALGYILNGSKGSVDMWGRLRQANIPLKRSNLYIEQTEGFPEI